MCKSCHFQMHLQLFSQQLFHLFSISYLPFFKICFFPSFLGTCWKIFWRPWIKFTDQFWWIWFRWRWPVLVWCDCTQRHVSFAGWRNFQQQMSNNKGSTIFIYIYMYILTSYLNLEIFEMFIRAQKYNFSFIIVSTVAFISKLKFLFLYFKNLNLR